MATLATQSGWLIERPGAPHGNFELMNSGDRFGPRIPHYWYDQTRWVAASGRWQLAETAGFGTVAGPFLGASLILSSYGNLECVATQEDGTVHHFALRGVLGWHLIYGGLVASGASGPPAFIQSRFGQPGRGNFELVAPAASGGLLHLFRDNAGDERTWHMAPPPATRGRWSGAGLIHSSFGNLEIVGVMDDRLTFQMQSGPGGPWSAPVPIDPATPVAGRPGFIQSRYGWAGNFEVVVGLASGKLAHYWRDNDRPGFPWSGPVVFGDPDEGPHNDVTVVHSSFGQLDAVARRDHGTDLVHYRAPPGGPWMLATIGPLLDAS